jgi:hypothetical protein
VAGDEFTDDGRRIRRGVGDLDAGDAAADDRLGGVQGRLRGGGAQNGENSSGTGAGETVGH